MIKWITDVISVISSPKLDGSYDATRKESMVKSLFLYGFCDFMSVDKTSITRHIRKRHSVSSETEDSELKKPVQINSDEYKDGEKIYWFNIDSWREIYGEDNVDTLVKNNA